MTITARNYAAQACRALKEQAEILRGRGSPDADRAQTVLDLVADAQHFVLPDGGQLFENGLRGLVGQKVRLPFPVVTLEYYVPPTVELLPEAPEYVPRVLIIATDVPAAKDTLGVAGKRGIAVFSMLFSQGLWVPNTGAFIISADDWDCHSDSDERLPCLTPAKSGIPEVGGMFLPWMTEIAEEMALVIGSEAAQRELVHNISAEVYAVLAFCEAMSCSNVGTDVIAGASAAVNARRIKDGKAPLLETKVLTVHVPGAASVRIGAGRKTGEIRQHLRRGHIRNLFDGRRIWVNSCVVGNPEKGRVEKAYRVLPEAVQGAKE